MPHKPAITLPFAVFLAALLGLASCRSVQSASFARASLGSTERAPLGEAGGEMRPETDPDLAADAASGVEAGTEAGTEIGTGVAADPGTRWPGRWGGDPEKPGLIVELDPAVQLRPVHLSRFHQSRATPAEYEDAANLAAAMGIGSGFKFKAEGPGSFIFTPDTRADSPRKDPPDLAFKFVSASPVDTRDSTVREEQDHVALQRTWFTFRDPKPATGGEEAEPLGTIVLLPGMFGTPEPIVDAAERYWHSRGYAVLRMLAHPSRFTQHLTLSVGEGLEEAAAARAARVSDDRIAECAYATDAALDHVIAARPGLADKPTVLVGMSGGAMALPTVYAYRPDRYDSAVLIAGGANFLRIMVESNYRDWIDAIILDFDPSSPLDNGTPTAGQVQRLSELYLGSSRLDAYHTAAEMSRIPVLMLHATGDRAVPAALGDILHQRLAEPERWTYPLGHELIFAGLPTQISRIDRWLTEHVLEAEGGPTATESPSGEGTDAADSQ